MFLHTVLFIDRYSTVKGETWKLMSASIHPRQKPQLMKVLLPPNPVPWRFETSSFAWLAQAEWLDEGYARQLCVLCLITRDWGSDRVRRDWKTKADCLDESLT